MSGSVNDLIANPKVAQFNFLDPLRMAYLAGNVRQQNAEQAAGQAAQKAIDPDTGQLDTDQFRRNLLAAGPDAAMAGLSALKDAQTLATARQSQAIQQRGQIINAYNGLLRKDANGNYVIPDGQLHDAVAGTMDDLVSKGIIPPQAASAALAKFPDDPTKARQQMETQRLSLLPPDQQQAGIYGGTGQQYDAQGNLIGVVQAPASQGGGVRQAPGAVPTIEGSRPVQVPTRAGAPAVVTQRQFSTGAGGGQPSVFPGASLRNPKAPGAATGNAAAGGDGFVGQTPAERSAAETTGRESAGNFAQEPKNDQAAQTQLAMLSNMQSDIGRFTTGSGAGRTLDIKRAIQSWAPTIAPALGIKPDAIASQESFDKIAAQIAQSQANVGSDSRMATSIAATPHSSLSPEGVNGIVLQLQGNSDFIRAKAKLAADYAKKNGTGDYQGFQNSIAALDPRVFQYDRMAGASPDLAHSWYNALPKDQKVAFQQAYAATHRLMGMQVPAGL